MLGLYTRRQRVLIGARSRPFFYVDRPPGDYTVSTSTEVEKNLTFTLEQGQPRYVRLNIGLGIMVGRVYGVLVDEETAQKEMASTSYLEKTASK